MPRKKAGRRSLAKSPGSPAPSQIREDQSIGTAHSRPLSSARPVLASPERFRAHRLILAYLPFTAVFFAVFGIGIMHDRPLLGALSIVACAAMLMIGGAR